MLTLLIRTWQSNAMEDMEDTVDMVDMVTGATAVDIIIITTDRGSSRRRLRIRIVVVKSL